MNTPKTVPHTPTPWRFDDGQVFAFEPSAEAEVLICDTAPDNVALTEYDEANAAHIVHCVNSHDRLVKACQRLVQWADALESQASQEERTAKSPPIIEAEAALAAAQPTPDHEPA